ncbi:bifunctional tRNA (5-methylaminomethyl-2-thiouridine)(34)-methyltransferase MnmD/FAD-dependent 5-carboxymethylaminomethyl-2-thiouridine(34) oxidoreductase MnmC [Nitrincola tibetensis]|uniref:tRNA 5-methylaminomethyl-2-thiouridine biosynthesis bifunctional protein MnmC n=1 Tax=Nitrincola tibetensis TaxID=2219697 RepID=A0A364NHZ7_9GAMM|nr:bifunctional tRNA (5-methylaminomethyl-2-thiouridine)(34)-methyltransferase MnmD/FAD-dependent 5-carboxymethylaminomethyl-2-thiouridine(34) oxidoreductase MnmC [Nitrincola tibetensis]RAU16683.1 bifunctional tRNA (5-methylaminomethyl-2-thiouridine)(34)-methyltransferase MnmD/FAD-dependent 5-carboxymethylaminomethyl-2-thiouridine(34) oxidoreductase MnmC [Nitrincola tibetensis]
MKCLKSANIEWHLPSPFSKDFDDVYYSDDGGEAEKQHVFINSNRLLERIKSLSPYQHLTIAETGFGTGLNFFLTTHLWLSESLPSQCLHFISFEKLPLSRIDMTQVMQQRHADHLLKDAFLAQYPPLQEGYHSLFFANGRIRLTLIFGDVNDTLPELRGLVDIWYLDGFSPTKNPDMWQASLFSQMYRLSHANTHLSTYTASGNVRRGLRDAGFNVQISEGSGRKRDMLIAHGGEGLTQPRSTPSRAIVVGAGLAGCHTARALAERGIHVTLIDQNPDIAQGGSGNPQGALYAKLAMEQTPSSELHLFGLLYSANLVSSLLETQPNLGALCGVLQLATTDKEQERQARLLQANLFSSDILQAVSSDQATEFANTLIDKPGLFFPKAGWVSPVDWCKHLVNHSLINSHFSEQVTDLAFMPNTDAWHIQTNRGDYETEIVILCSASDTQRLTPLKHLPLKAIRGQTSQVPTSGLPDLKTVVCGDGYISPALNQSYCFGATFDLHDLSSEIKIKDHQQNLQTLSSVLPDFATIDPSLCNGRVGYRCSTPDYLPLVGEVGVYDSFVKTYARLRVDSNWKDFETPLMHQGLYVNVGHGSKGLITCPISADVLVAMITGTPAPLPNRLMERLDPNRFILRDLIRNRI